MVEARYQKGALLYSGTVTHVHRGSRAALDPASARYSITYEDGDVERKVKMKYIVAQHVWPAIKSLSRQNSASEDPSSPRARGGDGGDTAPDSPSAAGECRFATAEGSQEREHGPLAGPLRGGPRFLAGLRTRRPSRSLSLQTPSCAVALRAPRDSVSRQVSACLAGCPRAYTGGTRSTLARGSHGCR